jgi:hypothetical protein
MAVPGLNPVATQPGKTAADSRLAIDATALALSGKAAAFTLATDDGGLSALAIFLREQGFAVTVACTGKAPETLRRAAHSLVDLPPPCRPCANPTNPLPRHPAGQETALDALLAAAIRAEAAGALPLARLNPQSHRKLAIRISSLPEKSWRTYLTARPHLYRCDPKGPEARVRRAPPT